MQHLSTLSDIKKRMVKALFSYTPVNVDELQLKVNDILEVIEETEEGWWKGVLDGNVGMFPSNFVIELDRFPEELNNKFMNELSPSKQISKDKTVPQQEPRHGNNLFQSKQGTVNSANLDSLDGSCSSKVPSDSTLERKIIAMKKPSGDSVAPRLPPKPVREHARVLFPYEALNEDELTLKEGDIITILSKEIEDKGWWKGELNNKIGVFPDNFVKLIKAEEQKKPERPDKPATVLASKNSFKSVGSEKTTESSPKLDKKVIKVPPAKPPPPEINKKESDRPPPPCPSKKPQAMQPVKKPMRSSLGPKSSSVKSPTSETIPSTFPPSEKPEASEVVLRKDNKKKFEMEFDAIESTGKKLEHMTANRAKAPSRRPPSYIFLKDTERDVHSHSVTDSRRLSEPSLADIEQLLPLSDTKKSNAVSTSNVEMKPKVPPQRPSFPVMKSNSIGKQDSIVNNSSGVSEESNVKPQDIRKKDTISDKVSVLMKEALQPKVPEPNPHAPSNRSSGISVRLQNQLAKVLPDVTKASPDVTKVTPEVCKIPPDLTFNGAPPDVTTVPPDVAAKVPPDVATKTSTKVTMNASVKSSNSYSNVQSIEVIPSVPAKMPASTVQTSNSSNEIILKPDTSLEAEVRGLKEDLKMAMVNMVSKNEYNALLKQVDELREGLDMLSTRHIKAISKLKDELEKERQLRQAVELELQQLKISQKT
ncbi:hypothetical protein JTE90_014910 [Oedothorax gibbosus]|uniref:SH3 domain-containing protein n=1 Tax=Oedothorax gibbosus TaxID=931172 RepID=A0AAV6VLR4_9ARAC|nr:hypothetical protein JTE90_014910 [Oedothorax gibbosus]